MNARTAKDIRKAALLLQPVVSRGIHGDTAHRPRTELKRLWHLVPWHLRHRLRLALAQGLLGELGALTLTQRGRPPQQRRYSH
jgi:hypothetical protein